MPEPLKPGIADFDARGAEPIGAALSIGIKSEKGQPIEKDRWHVMLPKPRWGKYLTGQGKEYSAPVRDPHPSFATYNAADVRHRVVVPATLTHFTAAEAFTGSYFGLELPDHPKRPNRAPCCVGNGVEADRWLGEQKGLTRIKCPGEQCPYRQRVVVNGREGKAPCGPRSILIARFNWPRDANGKGYPNIPFKFVSNSVFTYLNLTGFFASFRRACDGFGVAPDDVPLFGLPITLTVQEQGGDMKGQKTSFPVVSIAVAGDQDLLSWVGFQLQRSADVRRLVDARPVPALTDRTIADAILTDDADLTSGPMPSVGIPSTGAR